MTVEQRANNIFFKLGKTAGEAYEMIKSVYGSDCLIRSNIFRLYAIFHDGREYIEDAPRASKRRTSSIEENVKIVTEILASDKCVSASLIEELLGIPKSTVHQILTRICANERFLSLLHDNAPPHKSLLEAGLIILHDNAHLHIRNVVTEKLRQYGWEVLPHAPYSPDMSPPDFDLFPKLKKPMRGRCFPSLEELSAALTRAIRQINKDGVLDGTVKLPTRWDSVFEKQGDYIEGL
ncbi:hypothetical protein B7P43_G08373 [Cryptotermes secundus]|uniref:Mos1 transposase HTH domain-containing protein n=1 Tax=Cryptotermes secundus TaxID=105785 RepID=A0A2J7RAI4_9NEOP|nr:hypothetical protein B7P43_G08373 [Cryptotermes secundus]